MTKLVLYNYFRSSTSYRVRIALELKNLPYEYKAVHLIQNGGEQNLENYRNLNPMGGVPTLVHEGKVLSQSLVIMEYLDDVFPQSYKLFPQEAFLRAKVKQFCENINADLHSFGNLKVLQYLEKRHGYSQEEKEAWVQHWFGAGFKSLEKMLSDSAGTCCFGNVITAADVLLIPLVLTAHRFKLDTSAYPLVTRIYESCIKHPAFIKAHPFTQPDTPEDLKVKT